MKSQRLLFCLFLLCIIALTKIAYADEINFGKNTPSTSQVIDALSPATEDPGDAGTEKRFGKSRSIDMSNLKAPQAQTKSKQKHQMPHNEIAMSMEILFGYNSAELSDMAKDQLKPVGEAFVSNKLQNLDFVVEGHTDAIGSYAYNINLSEKRAAAVKQFLVETFHIAPSRMQIIGKGKNDLLDPLNPDSDVNRRVRIIATK
jgi:outer membrane protein OmpA-like peptidoglycan-associated protein